MRWMLPCAFLLLAQAASASPFVATLSILILGAELSFTGSGNGFNTQASVTLPGGTFSGTVSGPIKGTPSAMAIADLVPNGPGAFAGTPLAGPMPLRGNLRLSSKIAGYVDLALNSGYDLKAFGVGGVLTYSFPKPPIGGILKLSFAPWSAGVVSLPGMAGMYTGSDSRTPGGMGQITLVSPGKIVVDKNSTIMLGILVVEFVPEPGAPLLLATGAALLWALGARKRDAP